jgi:excisionase family DNA binding protein
VTLPPLLTSAQVAEYLKYSVETVYKLARQGRLNGVKSGGKAPWRFTEQAVLDYLEAGTRDRQEGASPAPGGPVHGRPARVPRRRKSHSGGAS